MNSPSLCFKFAEFTVVRKYTRYHMGQQGLIPILFMSSWPILISKFRNSIFHWIKLSFPVIFAITLVLSLRIFVIQFYLISGTSMLPSFKERDWVLVKKWGFPSQVGPWILSFLDPDVDRFDVLVLDGVGTELSLKRVVGLPGDFFRFSEGRILINDSSLEEPFINSGYKTQAPSLSILPVVSVSGNINIGDSGRIPPGYFLVLGDNREFSTDSRNYGLIPFKKLRGKVIASF